MVATGTAGTANSGAATAAPAGGGGVVPFFFGSNQYVEKFDTNTFQLTTTSQQFTRNVIPGGFLRGVRMEVRSTGGAGGTATADNPWNAFSSISLENIDGQPIIYPMDGYAHYIASAYCRPWYGDPARRFDYVQGINPSFSLFLSPEIRHTAGVLANTDARALYRTVYTLNTFANVITSGTTAPTLTVNLYAESWAQPDSKDLHGNPIEENPPGLNLQTQRRQQIFTLNSANANNTWQLSLTGNEIRCLMLIARDSNNARQDYLGDPIRMMIDTRSLGIWSPNELFNQMNDFYDNLSGGTISRQTGVYVWPRFYDPGSMKGQAWMATTNATYLNIQVTTASGAANLPGTVQMITDEVTPVGPVPMELDSI
jgi:hypothetical protein